MRLRVLTRIVNGWFTFTCCGAWVISSDGFWLAKPTSPIWVSTHLLPFWRPSCSFFLLLLQLSARMSSWPWFWFWPFLLFWFWPFLFCWFCWFCWASLFCPSLFWASLFCPSLFWASLFCPSLFCP